jgi:hypothetical protein
MAQQRDAPAFQEYAASMMARTDYRAMSLLARGLLYTLRLECWVNSSVPAEPALLAKVLGYPLDQVSTGLAEVAPFFKAEGSKLRCPELDDYRRHLEERRQRQADGGRIGAAKTNGSRRTPSATSPASTPPTNPPGRTRVSRGSSVKNSANQQSQGQAGQGNDECDSFVRDYNDYERATRGY